jgi:Secretion system C-terminal sorting domain
MKKMFTLLCAAILCATLSFAQNPINCNSSNCTTNSTIDQCPSGSSNVVTNFQNAVQKPGNPCGSGLCVNSVWRFTNVATVSGKQVDAEIKIIAINNAVLDDVDDDAATDQAGGSIASFFGPRIGPDVNLNNSNRRGFVEFEIKFYEHFSNPTLNYATLLPLTGLNFVHYDIDGHSNGANGWFRELGNLKEISTSNPAINASAGTELTTDATSGAGWRGFLGSVCERTGVSRCAQVAVSATYTGAFATLNFRMGYDYKAGSSEGNPVRQYGARFGCFDFPGGGPLPVTLSNLGINYKAGVATLNWTSVYESNMKGYEIERSSNGSFFENIGFTGAKNQLGVTQNYQFSNNIAALSANIIYYRLRMVDLDGKNKYSNVVTVRKDKAGTSGIAISPNPTANVAQLRLDAVKNGTASITVTDATGRVVLTQTALIAVGSNNISINNLYKLSEGIYNIRVSTGDEVYTERLMIKK